MRRATRITIPPQLTIALETNRALQAAVLETLAEFEPWLEDNKVVFFPEFTDHGPDHIAAVIATATALIPEKNWQAFTAGDAAALIIGVLLHDCAMHLSEDGFVALMSQFGGENVLIPEASWSDLWVTYVREATRFDGSKLRSLFGDSEPISIPELNPDNFTRRDRLLIGDFLRRNHARLAEEIALWGVPGPSVERLELRGFNPEFKKLVGLIARSHGISLRTAVSKLEKNSRRFTLDVHSTYIMALLRIADYLQIEAPRAPGQLLKVRSLRSPISQTEWAAHSAITELTSVDDDRESIYIVARPANANIFVHVRNLLSAIQRELDETWAALGEVYGPISNLRDMGLSIRRIRSNLDDIAEFAKTVNYLPVDAAFTTATANLLKLLIGPLYNHKRELGIRELLQNAVDAVLERKDLQSVTHSNLTALERGPDVVIEISTTDPQAYLTITDNGIGMSLSVLLNYFLRAGASFRHSDAWADLHMDATGKPRVLRSGRFGIGVLASFLLGESVNVVTRSYNDNHAINFEAGIEDQNIELRKASGPVGTTIKIPLSADTAEFLIGNQGLWDFFCLSEPSVERRIDGRSIDQLENWPSCSGVLPPTWRRLHHKDFVDLQWSLWEQHGRTRIACNGIRIEALKPSSPEIWDDGDDDDDDDDDDDEYDHESEYLGEIPWTPPEIKLSIFDRDGRLPLNLQRTSVIDVSFRTELEEEVAKDFLAFSATRLTASTTLSELFSAHLLYPGEHLAPFGMLPRPCFFRSPHGWLLPTVNALNYFAPERIVFVVANSFYGLNLPVHDSWYVCPILVKMDKYGTNSFLEAVRRFLGCRTAKLLMPQHTLRELINDNKFADFVAGTRVTPISRRLSCLEGDDDNGSTFVDFAMNQRFETHYDEHWLMAEINSAYISHDIYSYIPPPIRLPISYNLATTIWERFGIQAIPLKPQDRESLVKHRELVSYAQAHAELWREMTRLPHSD